VGVRPARDPRHEPLVRVEGLSKRFGAGPLETRVLNAAALELPRGATVSLMGRSGSGKSTLIALLAGLLLPDAGRIVVDGRDLTRLDDTARARLRARRIGVVLQSGNLIPFLTAAENVELAVRLSGRRRGAARARELLAQVGLSARRDHVPSRMSGGEVQRASVAVALANEPDLLLADEVTGELDAASAGHVMALLFGVARERAVTVLFVTHDGELAARAEQRLRLAGGQVRRL